MDFNSIPGKRQSHGALAPYQTPSDRFFGAGHQQKLRTPTVLSNAGTPSNYTRQNVQPSARHTGVQPSDGTAYATAPLHGLDSLHEQYSYGRTDPALPSYNAAQPLPSEAAHDQGAYPHLNPGYIALSDGLNDNDAQQMTVPIAVPSYTGAQPVYVEAINGLSGAYTNNTYLPDYSRHEGPNSQNEDVRYNPFDSFMTVQSGMTDVPIRDVGRQPQRIDVNHEDYPMDTFLGTMGNTPNQEEAFLIEMGNPADYRVPQQNSPTDDWAQNRRSTEIFPSSQDAGFRRQLNINPDSSPAKRKRSDSPETGPSSVPSPVKIESPTRHSQRRDVVGSDATRLAGEKRRKSAATFVCDICDNSFTRNHNRLNHMRTHLGEAGTQCDVCKRYLAKTSLSRHRKNCRGS